MTGDERRFLELELGMLLRRLKRNRDSISIERLRTEYKSGYEALLYQIREKAVSYVKETVFTGLGGYYQKDEVPELVAKLGSIVNTPEMKAKLQHALFKEPDMERVKCLAEEMRNKAEPLAMEYQVRAAKGE